tara:strand:+ start:1591 stop:4152 length:2562 start_codon:yes stop_codon:yes gene_type:complete
MEDDIATYLGHRGFTIKKESISIQEQQLIRKELNVKPFVPKSSLIKPQPFPVYRESKKKIYIPRFYGVEMYGEPDAIVIQEGTNIQTEFNGELRPAQKPIVKKFMKHVRKKGGGLLALHTGFGKCLIQGTPIMLSNGKIKKVENIKVGDKLMGDDSTPRTVLSLARGREMMYDIIPTKGDKYTVNESHILSLRCGYTSDKRIRQDQEAEENRQNQKYVKDKIIDIEVRDFLKLPKTIKNHLLKGYRVPVDFPKKKIDLDPYILGYWLGDGTSSRPEITTIEEPVLEYFRYYCEELGLTLKKQKSKRREEIIYRMSYGKKNRKGISGSTGKNKMLNMLKKHNLIMNKHIPHIYKCNSKDTRLELLAGIIDSDGYYRAGCYDIVQKNEKLLDDIIFVARSLGFAAYKKECEKSCMYKGEKKTGTYYRTTIHGDGIEYIPVKLERKKANKRKQIKNVLNTGIKVVKKEVDNYYGFAIDGNKRFLLGDFTVTHNTCLALNILSQLKKKTIIIVHKEFLLRQWMERIEQFLPNARVGKIQAKTIDVDDKDIVLCMLQSLSMKDYPKEIFYDFGFTIVDECHHLGAEVFSRAFFKIVTKYALGLSATMKRKDGLTKVLKWFLGDVVCKKERKGEDKVLVKAIQYSIDDEDFNKLETNYRGQIMYTTMIKKLCEFNNRSEFILKILKDLLNDNIDQQIMILGHQKKLLQYLHDAIKHRTIATAGYYIGGMKEKDLKISEGKKVIIATYAMAEEGLDIKTLTTLIMATPKVDVTQSVGRILRKKHKEAVVVDIVDSHCIFQRHYTKRKTFYRKQKFKIIETDMLGYNDNKWETLFDPENNIKKSFTKKYKKDPLLQGKCLI